MRAEAGVVAGLGRLQRLSGCAAAKETAATRPVSPDACSWMNLNVAFLNGELRRGEAHGAVELRVRRVVEEHR